MTPDMAVSSGWNQGRNIKNFSLPKLLWNLWRLVNLNILNSFRFIRIAKKQEVKGWSSWPSGQGGCLKWRLRLKRMSFTRHCTAVTLSEFTTSCLFLKNGSFLSLYAQYLRRRKPLMCTCCGIRWHRDMYSRKGTLSLRVFSIFGVWRVPKNEFASLVFEELMKRFESPWLKPVQTCLFCQTCLVRTTAYWFVDVWSLYYNLWQSIKNEITQEDLDTVYLMMHLS